MAVVLFTRVEGVKIYKPPVDRGVDFIVTLDGNAAREFGVEVKGAERPELIVRSDGVIRGHVATQLRHVTRDYRYPVGILIVDVIREKSWFGWVVAPNRSRDNPLLRDATIKTQPLDTPKLQALVGEVKRWYDFQAQ